MDDINDVLVEYFDYYINLSSFENYPNETKRSEISNKIKDVVSKAKSTSDYLSLVESANESIKEQRILITAKQYAEQIKKVKVALKYSENFI